MSQAVTKEAMPDDVTEAEIQRLIEERRRAGAQNVMVVIEGRQRFIVVTWPPL
jgi:UTP-glucose-1-phosphate uridylyltransferase